MKTIASIDRQMQNWLGRLDKAVAHKNKNLILELYDENIGRGWNWDDASSEMQQQYNDLTDDGNAICYSYFDGYND